MKIKWKIVLASIGIISLMTVSIVWFTHREVNALFYAESSEELENYSNMGLQLLEKAYPGDWSIVDGMLYKGEILINENYEIIDSFTAGTGVLATIFQSDTRVATNVQDETGKRMIGTQSSDKVIEEVLTKGVPYLGTADILGKPAQTYYIPIKDTSGTIVGMWFVGVYTNVVDEKINQAMLIIVILAGVLLIE